ncbi:hypothetical protein CYMTET_31542, partial [Cymbomonas tetramitiformis]
RANQRTEHEVPELCALARRFFTIARHMDLFCLEDLCYFGKLVEYKAGTTIVEAGAQLDSYYLMVQGSAMLKMNQESAGEHIVLGKKPKAPVAKKAKPDAKPDSKPDPKAKADGKAKPGGAESRQAAAKVKDTKEKDGKSEAAKKKPTLAPSVKAPRRGSIMANMEVKDPTSSVATWRGGLDKDEDLEREGHQYYPLLEAGMDFGDTLLKANVPSPVTVVAHNNCLFLQ